MKAPLWIGLCLLLAACGGTGTGNPGETNTAAGPAEFEVSASILQSICTLLVSCSGSLSPSTCVSGIQNTSGIEVTLGLRAGSYSNYGAIESAEAVGSIQGNKTAAVLCESQISALSCSNVAVRNAYQQGATNPFADVPAMMPASCGSVF